jgi:hypothetical protein
MKASSLFLIYSLLSLCSYSQLKVDAGIDTALCYSESSFRLGGNPPATGGIPPYSYTWEVKHNDSDYTNLLDYHHFSNPTLRLESLPYKGRYIFILNVTDSANSCKSDTMVFTVSFMGWSHLSFAGTSVKYGDSLQLDIINDYFGIPPFKYQWYPTTGLSDPTARNPWLKPTASCDFGVTITDSVGCVGHDMYYVLVHFTGIETNELSKNSIVFPNPINSGSTINLIESSIGPMTIRIFDSSGRIILFDSYHQNYCVGDKIKDSGVYFYVIYRNGGTFSTGKLVKL